MADFNAFLPLLQTQPQAQPAVPNNVPLPSANPNLRQALLQPAANPGVGASPITPADVARLFNAQPAAAPAPVAAAPAPAPVAPTPAITPAQSPTPIVAPRPAASRAAVPTAQAAAAPVPQAPSFSGDTTLFDPFKSGDAGAGAGIGAPTIGGKFYDPSAAISTGYNQQLSYQQAALQNIMDAARQGNPGNYSFRLAHLVGAMGQNNFGAIQAGGVNGVNNAIAGITSAGLGAGATLGAAGLGLQGRQEEIALQRDVADSTPVPIGQTPVIDPRTGLVSGSNTTYGIRKLGSGGMPTTINVPGSAAESAAARKPAEGATGKTKTGQAVVYRNGQWVAN